MNKLFTLPVILSFVFGTSLIKAQEAGIPHTPTFPGVASSPIPYQHPDKMGFSGETFSRLSDEIKSWVDTGKVVGAELLVVKRGKAVFHEAFGWSDRDEHRPMQRNSVFYIGGMAKPFTAAAVLRLAGEGLLSLKDPVRTYISNFPDTVITVQDLLLQKSGFNWIRKSKHGDADDVELRRNWIEALATDERRRTPGTFKQSDYNYVFLGHIVSEVTGKTIEAYVKEQIIRPLELKDTFVSYKPGASWVHRLNSRYRWDKNRSEYRRYWKYGDERQWPFYPGANNVYTTAMDYARFMQLWLNNGQFKGSSILPGDLVRRSLELPDTGNSFKFGYGWYVWNSNKEGQMPARFQLGSMVGSMGIAFPASETIVVYFTQSSGHLHHPAFIKLIDKLKIFD